MKRKAGVVQICGLPFTIYVGDDKGIPELRGEDPEHHNDGYCDATGLRIYIRHGLARAYALGVLFHEIMHAIWFHASVEQIVGATDLANVEESFISHTAPHILAALESMKGLRL